MKTSIKYTYIIPAYNKEGYIKRTIESLKKINQQNVEFIIIDDGSTDCTPKIIDREIQGDNRFNFIRTKNFGVSSARNLGINNARGEYILFCDADDQVNPNIIKSIDKLLSLYDYDLIQYNFSVDGKKNNFIHDSINNLNSCDKLKYMLEKEILNSVCTKCFKKEVIASNKIQFNDLINLGEDLLFSFEFYINSREIIIMDYIGYYYDNKVKNSLTNNHNYERYKTLEDTHSLILELANSSEKISNCNFEQCRFK